MRRVISAVNEYEMLMIRARTVGALLCEELRSERYGTTPYGHDSYIHPTRVRVKKGTADTLPLAMLAPNPAEEAAIAVMTGLRNDGMTLREIAAELTRQGVPTKNGRDRWNHRTVDSILKRTARDSHDQAQAARPEPDARQ